MRVAQALLRQGVVMPNLRCTRRPLVNADVILDFNDKH